MLVLWVLLTLKVLIKKNVMAEMWQTGGFFLHSEHNTWHRM